MKRIIFAGCCILLLLLPHVLGFTKSREFIDATTMKEGKDGRVGIAAGQFAPKEPRFKKYIPPRVIPSITVLTVGFRNFTEPAPVVLSPEEFKEFKKQKEEKAKAQKPAEPEEKEEKETPKNIRNAILSVKSARVPDQRVSVRKGNVLSLAIILIGMALYGTVRFVGRKPSQSL